MCTPCVLGESRFLGSQGDLEEGGVMAQIVIIGASSQDCLGEVFPDENEKGCE